MRRITTLIAGVVAGGALGLAGCTTPSPATGPAVTRPSPDPAPWRLFAEDVPPERRGTFETVGREYALSSDPSAPTTDPDSRSLVVHRETGRVVHRFSPEAPQRQAYRALFFEGHAMILDGSYTKAGPPDPDRDQSVLWRVDLVTGQRDRFRPTTVKALSLSEQMTERGRSVVLPAVSHDDRSCLVAVDVATLRDELLHCAPAGATILRVDAVRDGLSWLQAGGAGYADCKSRWWRDPAGAITPLAPETGCGAWEGLRLDGWTFVASLADPGGAQYDFSRARATDGVSTVDFGSILTSTVVACGEHVYWIAADQETQQAWQEVRRWRPGDRGHEVVLRTEGDAGRRPPACSQGVLTVSNARTLAEPYYVRTRYLEQP
ncbi:hypothetical protein [Umezawaea beigongshangensis]|uniref:hypothetical protein n=1 Tax=Umezawaea beigongshangensis TaxID=2780383 RepID=UPI0018F239E6|nr:hypothetical protein [Umezawaea beigongshangensis]